MAIENNINELLQLLDASNNILISNLTHSSTIEDSIKQNGGSVVYSYNNIIVASEISETLYNELQKNPNIDYIESLALKQYGEVSSDLISKMDSTNQYIVGNSGDTTSLKGIVSANTSGTDGKSGNSGSNGISGIGPAILNNIFTLSSLTNEIFNYPIITSGTTPIDFAIVQPETYYGTLALKNINIINGQATIPGVYNIKFLATNDYGTDVKFLTLSITEPTKITNTNLNIYTRIETEFYYTIESSGPQPKVYDVPEVVGLGLDLIDNIISGIFYTPGIYNMTLIVSGTTESDSKTLTVDAGFAPVIISDGQWTLEQNKYSSYTITSNFSATYNLIGILPQGLNFREDTISGNPIQQGEYYVTLMATNSYGEDSKELKITVYQMGQ